MRTRVLIAFSLLWLLSAGSLALADDDPPPPSTPAEFHALDGARYERLAEDRAAFRETPGQSNYDAFYYDLTLDMRDYTGQTIRGDATVWMRSEVHSLSQVVLDFCGLLSVDSLFCGGTLRPFTQDNLLLTVSLDRPYDVGETVVVRVCYHGRPCATSRWPSVVYYSRPIGGGRTVPTIYTLSEPYGARDWWPCKNIPSDKADSLRMAIIVADTMIATSNGMLEQTVPVPPSSMKYVWVERYPIATYLVSVCATNYVHYSDVYINLSGDSVPIEHYSYPERLGRARESWNRLPEMMSVCAQLFGEYPFVLEKYGHTMFNFYGALEHQVNTSYGRNLADSTHYYDFVVVHELGHQWWGDEVTPADWPDIWLSEGFASYTEALWQEHLGGFGAYRSYMVTTTKLGVVDPSGPVYNPTDLFNSNTVYHKGAWILHTLRGLLGNDSLFFESLRTYRARHSLRSATTADFLSDVSNATGLYVTPYLYAYLYLTNRPRYGCSFGSGIVDGGWQTVVRIRQTQTDPDTTFRTRLDLRFASGSDTARVRVENEQRETRYYFRLGLAPTQLVLDPDDWVLKQTTAETFPLTILNDHLDFGLLHEWYSDTLVAAAGVPPLVWSCVGGELPEGLNLSSQGVLSGVPQRGDIYTPLIRVQDASGAADSATFQIYITPFTPTPPQNLSIRTGEAGMLVLAWQRTSPADSFRVYRATLSDFSDAQCILTTADTTAVDTISSADFEVLNRFYCVTAVRYP